MSEGEAAEEEAGDEGDEKPRVNVIGEGEAVPVYNCAVIVSRLDNGKIHGQVANLDGIEVTGSAEREVLQEIIKRFKKEVGKYIEAKQPIPWIESPMKPTKDQVENLIAVHL